MAEDIASFLDDINTMDRKIAMSSNGEEESENQSKRSNLV